MDYSRRDLGFLLPLLAAATAKGQQASPAQLPLVAGKVYHDKAIPYQGDDQKKGREFFHGSTHGGFNLQMHETILGKDIRTHEPHKHEHEEMIFVMEGSVETWVEGKTEIAETGSVIYLASNLMHSAKNAGTVPCRYYVLELRGKEA